MSIIKVNDLNVVKKNLGEIINDWYIFDIKGEKHYIMLIPNGTTEGYNYFEVFIDKENKIVHLYDGLESYKSGLSSINMMTNSMIEGFSKLMGIDTKEITIAIYCPDNTSTDVYICIYTLDGFGGKLDSKKAYKPFIVKVEN